MAANFKGLKAVFINCSLKRSSAESHTQKLVEKAANIMRTEGVDVNIIHALEQNIAFGMEKDLSGSGVKDDWPKIQQEILGSDIFVLASPIWLGAKSSVATLVIERMYAYSGDHNEKGQYIYYGKTAGCLITGNEDGVKHCSMDILYAMQHIGYTIPPQADAGWIGEAGPGPSYGDIDEKTGKIYGYDNDFTNRNTTFMAWNLMHCAKMLKDQDGYPALGNVADEWQNVTNAKHQNPEYH